MTCASPNVPALNFIYSYATPSIPIGTVVIFSGGSGTLGTLGEHDEVAAGVYADGYEVVEVAWQTDWEQTSDILGIQTASCRPAGFLNYALQNPLLNVRLSNSKYGFCAEGGSAGAGALAYALSQYTDQGGTALSSDIDDAEFTSGPAFGDIRLGCQVPGPPTVAEICPSGQFGCSSGTTNWGDPYPYIAPYISKVGTWTNDATCANSSGTSALSNSKWLAMSIVNGTSGSFTYATMGMAGWLCASSVPSSCTPSSPCPNNSAAEGNVFLSQITSGSQALGYKLTGILNCQGQEGVADGSDPDVAGETGAQAIVAHIKQQCKHPSPH
ncbi:MAG TPA: hypothetical protein VKV15_17250 [Bryobacteraceae bacterium]|nr:hypothetical protein [Bryobacteraceae bacterium]